MSGLSRLGSGGSLNFKFAHISRASCKEGLTVVGAAEEEEAALEEAVLEG